MTLLAGEHAVTAFTSCMAEHLRTYRGRSACMHDSAGLSGGRAAHLLTALRLLGVLHHLNGVAGTKPSLSVDSPLSALGDIVLVDSSDNPLISIVTCSSDQLQAHVDESKSDIFGDRSLSIQLEKGNVPNQFFLLPNDNGSVLPEGEYHIDVVCGNSSSSNMVALAVVSVIDPSVAVSSNQPYFTSSPRTVNISASAPPGTVVANYKAAEVSTRPCMVDTALLHTLMMQLRGYSCCQDIIYKLYIATCVSVSMLLHHC